MDQKEKTKRSKLLKIEAMSLFTSIKAVISANRWWYFDEMNKIGRSVRIDQKISPYRASLSWNYIFCGIDCQIYLEREAHVGQIGENLWHLSFSGIEGKDHALTIENHLKHLNESGYYIPNGNENLERQMNFSLGLYGACLMHVDIHFPIERPPLSCVLEVMDYIESINSKYDKPLNEIIKEIDKKRASLLVADEEEDPDIIMGDWQTWK